MQNFHLSHENDIVIKQSYEFINFLSFRTNSYNESMNTNTQKEELQKIENFDTWDQKIIFMF